MVTMIHNNENASAGGIVTLVAIFLLAGALFIANGYAIDRFTQIANIASFAGGAASQLRYDVINLMVMVFRFEPILVLLSLGINRLMSANMQFSEVTPLSTLAFGAAEMILLTVVLVAVTMFGGYGLDTVVGVVTGMNLGDGNAIYDLIQYIPNIFYGCMFLALIGVCIQFVLECVQVADHSNSFTQSN